MKNFIKILAIVLIAAMAATAFASCGDENSIPQSLTKAQMNESITSTTIATETAKATEATETSVVGKTETWGNITVFVPEGMKLNGGSLIDKESKDKLSLNADVGMSYYNISVVSAEQAANDVAATKTINADADPKDVSFAVGSTEWKGVTHTPSGIDCFHIYGAVDGKVVEILAGWNKIDSAQTKAVLGSLKIADNGSASTEPAQSSEPEDTTEPVQSSEPESSTEPAVSTDPGDTSESEPNVDTYAIEGPDADGWCTFGGLAFKMPENFKLLDGSSTQLVPNDYPWHSDNINFTMIPDIKSMMTSAYVEQSLSAIYDIENFTYGTGEIPGAEYVAVTFDINYSGVSMSMVNYYYFFGGKGVSVTYTTVSGELDDAFAEVEQSIKVA